MATGSEQWLLLATEVTTLSWKEETRVHFPALCMNPNNSGLASQKRRFLCHRVLNREQAAALADFELPLLREEQGLGRPN